MTHERIIVGIAEGKTVRGEGELVSYALGSCVGICLYDRARHVAGLAHILLPCRAAATEQGNPFKFADSGVDALIRLMEHHGAHRRTLVAKLAGGARMFETPQGQESVGDKNIAAVRQALQARDVPIAAQDVGANYGRSIYFSAQTGMLRIKAIYAGERLL